MFKLLIIAASLSFATTHAHAKLITVEDGSSFIGTYQIASGSSKECHPSQAEDFDIPTDQVALTSLPDYQGIRIGDTLFNQPIFDFKTEVTSAGQTEYVNSEKITLLKQVSGFGNTMIEDRGELTVVSPGVVELHMTQKRGESLNTMKVVRDIHCQFIKIN